MPCAVEISPDANDHLDGLTARERSIVLAAVAQQLVHQPTVTTRNRKPMKPNPFATWELRVGNLRMYYDVEETPEPTVLVRAVGTKLGNRVRIGREVFSL